MKKIYTFIILSFILLNDNNLIAGNPDRQGEAGASELLMNPWAISSGFHALNTACVGGVEAMRLNIAGLSRVNKGEFILANTQLYSGAGISMNAGGFATKLGSKGTLGISLVSLDFGDIPITTVEQPEGTEGTFSPSFFNIGVGYSYMYENKISIGVLVRGISEALPSVSAFGLAIDAGVQYVAGPKDNFKLGISLRNTGGPMEFNGQGLAIQAPVATNNGENTVTVTQRPEDFELPSQLNLGVSYDFYVMEKSYVRALGNFVSNAFSQDQVGVGAEFNYNDMFMVRAGYKYNLGSGETAFVDDVYTGLAAGFSAMFPVSKENKERRVGIDYAYRATNPFKGTHNVSLRYAF